MVATQQERNCRFKSILNQRFGKLVVIAEPGREANRSVIVACDCGSTKTVLAVNLKFGRTKSCGCAWHSGTHGLANDPTYNSWWNMVDRCTNPKADNWDDYGGRGITVCERWLSIAAFVEDMGLRTEGTTLGRLDNDGNYEPGNCAWQTNEEQGNNRRDSRFVSINSERLTVTQWARRFGVPPATAYGRIKRGWKPEDAVSVPPRHLSIISRGSK